MSRPAAVAIGLWLALAIIVFNVRFDWQTRIAGHVFVQSQLARHRQGLPPVSINDGFRPMVRDAAGEAALWLMAVSGFGLASVIAVQRVSR
ncbi:MAG TPA: hypothetical protein VEC39_11490 [Vicinamibacterales bacterium]|nr:hypothetical protein [Vicinamibacterales bacterium]